MIKPTNRHRTPKQLLKIDFVFARDAKQKTSDGACIFAISG